MTKLAVILPEKYRGGTLRGAKNIARMIRIGASAAGDSAEISFGYVDDKRIYSAADFDDLRDLGIACRPFRPEAAESSGLNPYLIEWFRRAPQAPVPHYVLFNDGVSNFEDCDFWLIVSDRVSLPIPPHRRYAVVTYDYIQRYVPEIFGSTPETDGHWINFEMYARFARSAEFVVCTTAQTRSDCLALTGAEPARVHVFPMEFDPLDSAPATIAAKSELPPYAIWTTNTTEHKNHLNVIRGLEEFFSRNPDSKLQIKISGFYTELFSSRSRSRPDFDNAYIAFVRKTLEESVALRRRVTVLGNVPDSDYVSHLSSACFCLHGAKYDNGTYSVLEAAWLSVPSITSDYPAMREMASRFSVPMRFFDPFKPDTLAEAIDELLENRIRYVSSLPSRDVLRQFSFRNTAPSYWRCLKEAMAIS